MGVLARIGEAIIAPIRKSLRSSFVEIAGAAQRLVNVANDLPQLVAARQDRDFYTVLTAIGRAIGREQFSLQKTRRDGVTKKELVFWTSEPPLCRSDTPELRVDVSETFL